MSDEMASPAQSAAQPSVHVSVEGPVLNVVLDRPKASSSNAESSRGFSR